MHFTAELFKCHTMIFLQSMNDRFEFRNDLAVRLTCIVARATEHGDLEQQLERNEQSGKFVDTRAPRAKMFAYQIQIASQPAIRLSQSPIDSPELKAT